MRYRRKRLHEQDIDGLTPVIDDGDTYIEFEDIPDSTADISVGVQRKMQILADKVVTGILTREEGLDKVQDMVDEEEQAMATELFLGYLGLASGVHRENPRVFETPAMIASSNEGLDRLGRVLRSIQRG
jgi:hypothetical protein